MTDFGNITDNGNNIKELQIEKYPMAESPNLFEYFLIMGYEESYIQEKIIENFDPKIIDKFKEIKSKDKNVELFDEQKCRNLPTILFSVGSNFAYPMEDEVNIIRKVFPIPPSVFYTSIDNNVYEPSDINFIFTNIQNVAIYIGYVFIFYEQKIINEKAKIFIPKAFVIISQYPFFCIFQKMCKELLDKQFKNEQIQIPIEIQLYNIVNFIPAPVNENINITFFPSYELYDIIKNCNTDSDLFELNRKKQEYQEYKLKQLSGYRQSEIDFSSILCLFPVDVIVKVYLQLLTGHTIAVFSKNISTLNSTIYIFQQFFYPLNHDESVFCVSPVRYFCSEFLTQNLLGFLCSYEEVNNYNPFRDLKPGENKFLSEEEENDNLDPILFGCDFVFDLDKQMLINIDNNKKMENYKEHKYKTQKILNLAEAIYKGNNLSELENSIKILIDELKEISLKKTMYQKKEKEKAKLDLSSNKKIQNAFYKFNLDISYQYFQYYSSYNGSYLWDKISIIKKPKSILESGLKERDYLFFSLFSETFYCNILNIFVGGYSEVEPVLYKTPRIIFENFIFFKKLSEKENQKINSLDFLEIIDKIYIKAKKEKQKEKNISFLNFYKFYQNNLVTNIYNFMNPKYVNAKKFDHNKINIKYLYKYKGIDLDKNLLMEYIYILENLTKEEKNLLFNINFDEYLKYKPIEQTITYINIINTFEDYFIDIKYFESKDIIKLSILNILALSIRNKTLLPYIFTIYSLFDNLSISTRKYIEIILSISLRLLKKEKNPNFFAYEKYFNLYQLSMDSKNLFPNDQLIYLKKEINLIKSNINLNECSNIFDERYDKIKDKKKLYNLKFKSNKKLIAAIKNTSFNGALKFKISLESKIYTSNENTNLDELYSPKTIYNITKNMLDIYYEDLDFSKINYNDYEKAIINLIFYTEIFEKEFPKDINNFLFFCLEL